ncbi:hypothetical protein IFM89_018434, partial [Coptis chinensis]
MSHIHLHQYQKKDRPLLQTAENVLPNVQDPLLKKACNATDYQSLCLSSIAPFLEPDPSDHIFILNSSSSEDDEPNVDDHPETIDDNDMELLWGEEPKVALAFAVKAASTPESCVLGKKELMQGLRKVDICLQNGHGQVVDDMNGNSDVCQVPRAMKVNDLPRRKEKKVKGYGRAKGPLEKKRKSSKTKQKHKEPDENEQSKQDQDVVGDELQYTQ